jgi:hypothetical protein
MSVVLVHQGPSLNAPILQEVGVDDQPELYQAHTFVSA